MRNWSHALERKMADRFPEVAIMICQSLADQLLASAFGYITDLVASEKSRHFAQPRPSTSLIVAYSYFLARALDVQLYEIATWISWVERMRSNNGGQCIWVKCNYVHAKSKKWYCTLPASFVTMSLQELNSAYWFHHSSPLHLLEFQAFRLSSHCKIQPRPHISLYIEYNDKGVSNDSTIWLQSTLRNSLLNSLLHREAHDLI